MHQARLLTQPQRIRQGLQKNSTASQSGLQPCLPLLWRCQPPGPHQGHGTARHASAPPAACGAPLTACELCPGQPAAAAWRHLQHNTQNKLSIWYTNARKNSHFTFTWHQIAHAVVPVAKLAGQHMAQRVFHCCKSVAAFCVLFGGCAFGWRLVVQRQRPKHAPPMHKRANRAGAPF
jgi:hypothetical protein